MAWEHCPKMPVIPVEWYEISEITSIFKKENVFIFRAKIYNKVLSFQVTFPKIGGVRLCEHAGFFTASEVYPIQYSGSKIVKMKAGEQTVIFKRDTDRGFILDVINKDGITVFSFNGNDLKYGLTGNKIKKIEKIKLSHSFTSEEILYGLGERSNTLNQVGHKALLWNVDTAIHGPARDSGVDHNEAYQNVPLLHSNKGYSLFANTMYAGWAEFGVDCPGYYSFDFNGPECDFFVFTDSPKKNMFSYTELTGHSIIPPKWVFQYWMGGGADQWLKQGKHWREVFREYIDGYKKLGIPQIAGCYGEGAPSLNKEGYEIASETGMRMFIWNHPSLEKEFTSALLGTDDPKAQPLLYIPQKAQAWKGNWIDFTHPNAKPALREFYKEYFDWGLKGAMIDFGEFVHTGQTLYNGKDGNAMHNEHSYWYAKTMKEIFEERCGDDFVLFQRSGCAGSQAFVGQFGGDQAARFYGLKQAFYSGLNMMSSGFNIWGSDLGGYNGTPTPELYMRWLEFAIFSPMMRSHGVGLARNPWEYGEQATELFKKMYWWRENMLDYVFSSAVDAHLTAAPMMRVMAMEYPGEGIDAVDTQYMFGSELLVAPVLEPESRIKMVVFPKGYFVNLWTGERIEGGRRLVVDAPEETVPVYLRAGAVMLLKTTESLEFGENMVDKATITTLLTTPAENRREVRHYFDEKNYADFVTDVAEDAVLVLENKNNAQVDAVVVKGVQATAVIADGEAVEFACKENETRFRLPNGFRKIVIK